MIVEDLPGAGQAFASEVPGRVPGSKAIYRKEVDAAGETIRYTKTTVGPDGTVVHLKEKFRRGPADPGPGDEP